MSSRTKCGDPVRDCFVISFLAMTLFLLTLLMSDCIFCKIISGEIPSYKVYEDEKFLVFLDITPFAEGHCLVVPKDHYRWTYDVPDFGEYWEVAKKVSKRQLEVLKCDFVSFLTLGNQVPHAHIHVIPRWYNDPHQGCIDCNIKLDFSKEKFQEILEKLKF